MQHHKNVETQITEALPVPPQAREESAGLEDSAPQLNQATPQPYSALND